MDGDVSENSFRRGLEAIHRRAFLEALAYFESAVRLARRQDGAPVPMKYLSYYGLCLAVCSDRFEEASALCETAVRGEFYNPDLYWNLGRVYLRAGDRHQAYGSFVRGLRLNPRHKGLIGEIRRLGMRKKPIVRFFPRSHPLNRILGRLHGRFAGGAAGRGRATLPIGS
jgi:tetratricopeptide (TPR) repeat protein